MPDRIGPIPFIYNAISEGLNATQALRAYREGGGQIRTQRFYAAFGEVGAEMALVSNVQGTPRDQPFSSDVISTIASNRPGAYLYRGGVFLAARTVDPTTGKVQESTQLQFGMVRSSDLLTPAQVEAALMDLFAQGGQSATAYTTPFGAFPTAVNELVSPEDAEE